MSDEARGSEQSGGAPAHGEGGPAEMPRLDLTMPLRRPARRAIPKGLVAPARRPGGGVASTGESSAPERTLIVGRGIEVSGQVSACSRLIVEGVVHAELDAEALEVRAKGRFEGKAEVDQAEIHGDFHGDLTVQGHLHIGETGRVSGTIRYAGIRIDSGGRLSGNVNFLPSLVESEQTEVA